MGLFDRFLGKKPANPRALFLREVLAVARAIPDLKSVTPLSDVFGLSVDAGGGERRVFLDNLFAETREVPPEQRPDSIRHFLMQVAVRPDQNLSWDEVCPLLRPVIRAPMLVWPPGDDPTLEPFCREILPCLREHLVLDHEHTMAFVLQFDAKRWGQPDHELYQVAYANMEEEAASGIELFDAEPSPIWHVATGDGYESSRLLLPGFLASFVERVEGRPIAIVPHRSTLFIAGDANPRTVVRLCETARREYAASPRSVSSAVYAVDHRGALVPYVRTADDEATERVRDAHLEFVGGEYSAQKQLLDKHYAKNEIDIFVASFSAVKTKSRGWRSYCTWAYGVLGLLPKTDCVAIALDGRDKAQSAFVPWDEVVRIAGDQLLPEPGVFPPRWRTAQEPLTDAKLAELQALKVELD